jgi:hypothetical protein
MVAICSSQWKHVESGGIAPCILNVGTSWRRMVSFTSQPLYPRWRSRRYPLDMRLGGLQSQSGRCRVETISFILAGNRTSIPWPSSRMQNETLINEWWTEKNIAGNDCELLQGTILAFSYCYWGKPRRTSVRVVGVEDEIWNGDFTKARHVRTVIAWDGAFSCLPLSSQLVDQSENPSVAVMTASLNKPAEENPDRVDVSDTRSSQLPASPATARGHVKVTQLSLMSQPVSTFN